MSHPKILVCLDSDSQASVFDGVVAVDSGVDHLFRHAGVQPEDVRDLVHGAMFTRGSSDLQNTAIFVGGANVEMGEKLLAAAVESFFGPVRVSVMLDSNGSNTTAAAAVLAASRHLELSSEVTAVVIGTGPVGQRAAHMLASEGVATRVVSRTLDRAEAVCQRLEAADNSADVIPYATSGRGLAQVLTDTQLVISAGPAGVEVMPEDIRVGAKSLQVAIDLNAVPPLGIGGIGAMDKAVHRDSQYCYGALGVGGLKMKLHKRAIQRLFETNDLVLDADEIYSLGKELGQDI